MHRACGVIGTACIFYFCSKILPCTYAMSMTPHAYRKFRITLRIQGYRTDVLMKKTVGRKSRDTVPLTTTTVCAVTYS
jgi:hypothetical protein